MKSKVFYSVIVMIFLGIILSLISSCGGKGGDPAVDKFQFLQSGTWKVQGVTISGVDATGDFTGLTVTFSASSFTSTNGDPVWPNSGSWSKSTENTFTRGDGLVVTIDNVASSALQISFNWAKTTLGGGRIASVAGNYVIKFTK